MSAVDDNVLRAAVHSLIGKTRSLQLATVGEDGTPHIGYTPFVCTPTVDTPELLASEGTSVPVPTKPFQFSIFVSELALHTRDLLATPVASIMLIADEAASDQIFARRRVYYECDAQVVTREDSSFDELLGAYRERHGKMVDLLATLPDFRLFTLLPTSGQFVMGFGKAYKLGGKHLHDFESSRRA